jgi:hypothetical protein
MQSPAELVELERTVWTSLQARWRPEDLDP